MMIKINDLRRRMAVAAAGRATATGGVTVQLTRMGGRRLVSVVPFW
jgi:hypothetical protein